MKKKLINKTKKTVTCPPTSTYTNINFIRKTILLSNTITINFKIYQMKLGEELMKYMKNKKI